MYEYVEATFSCITSLHVGCGQDTGIVDLPVIRERTTGFPIVPGSGNRGVMRQSIENQYPDAARQLLGDSDNAGCVIIPDAKILLFPVISSSGVFHWVTCPFVLRRYARDRRYFCSVNEPELRECAAPSADSVAGGDSDAIMLAEYPFVRETSWDFPLAIEDVDPARVLLVPDNWFRYFVTYCTEVRQHNRLTTEKTVKDGQLFSVESVPAETVFYSHIGATRERVASGQAQSPADSLQSFLDSLGDGEPAATLTLGGDESTGSGVTRLDWVPNAEPLTEGT